MREELRKKLAIQNKRLKEINEFLLDPNNEAVNALLDIIEKYGGPKEINRKAKQARKLSNLMRRLKESGSPYILQGCYVAQEAG